ncbi:type II toxin-antitoxin system VapC family toxin [Candidatus Daviesbacteria bacterium]|nr:type II toxin-antitoxin system VapC family toxin [Candidatus Daviesbacteria bacterium]
MSQFFIDSSAWLAYYLSDEPDHLRIKNIIKTLLKENRTIVTSNDIIDETVTFLIYNKPKLVPKFIDFIKKTITTNSVIQLWVDEQTQAEAFEIVEKFAEHKLSLTDATTIALVKKFSIESVISLDSDFVKVGIHTLP